MGVSVDAAPTQAAFARSLEVTNFPLLSDWPLYATCKAYDVWREDRHLPGRVTYVIDKLGTIRGVVESDTDMEIHSKEALQTVKGLTS